MQSRIFKTSVLQKLVSLAWKPKVDILMKHGLIEEPNPLHLLPNVRKFKVKALGPQHPVFEKYGIFKRELAPIFETQKYKNGTINRYVTHQFIRLSTSREHPKKFWRIAFALLKSPSYQVMCFNHVFHNWHRNMKLTHVVQIMRNVNTLVLELNHAPTPIEFTRHFIAKANGSQRPLGVPSAAWRVVLHGLNSILIIYFAPYHSPNQHGFWPQRGTDTAWREIHNLIPLTHLDIYEFDLKEFFDSINLSYLRELLEEIEIPYEIVKMLDTFNRSLPVNEVALPKTWGSDHEMVRDYHYYIMGNYQHLNPLTHHLWKWLRLVHIYWNPKISHYEYFRGVPQGSPLSPLLASIALHKTLLSHPNIIQYADDGLLYGYKLDPFPLLTFPPESGMEVNWSKSGWIRREATYVKPLKFLGKYFVPKQFLIQDTVLSQDGALMNATRVPKPYTFEHYGMIVEAEHWDRSSYIKPIHPSSFEKWFKSKYQGFVSSRIYNGGLLVNDVIQDFHYTFIEKSWSWHESKRRIWPLRLNGEVLDVSLDIFNSSSFAAKALLLRIRHERRMKIRNAVQGRK